MELQADRYAATTEMVSWKISLRWPFRIDKCPSVDMQDRIRELILGMVGFRVAHAGAMLTHHSGYGKQSLA